MTYHVAKSFLLLIMVFRWNVVVLLLIAGLLLSSCSDDSTGDKQVMPTGLDLNVEQKVCELKSGDYVWNKNGKTSEDRCQERLTAAVCAKRSGTPYFIESINACGTKTHYDQSLAESVCKKGQQEYDRDTGRCESRSSSVGVGGNNRNSKKKRRNRSGNPAAVCAKTPDTPYFIESIKSCATKAQYDQALAESICEKAQQEYDQVTGRCRSGVSDVGAGGGRNSNSKKKRRNWPSASSSGVEEAYPEEYYIPWDEDDYSIRSFDVSYGAVERGNKKVKMFTFTDVDFSEDAIETDEDGEFSFNLTLRIIDGRCVKLNSSDRWVVNSGAPRRCENDKYYPYRSLREREKASWRVKLSGRPERFTLSPVDNKNPNRKFFGFADDVSLYAAIKRMLSVSFGKADLMLRRAHGLEFSYGNEVFNNKWQIIYGAGLQYLLNKYKSSEEGSEHEAIKLERIGREYTDSKYDLEWQIQTLLMTVNREING